MSVLAHATVEAPLAWRPGEHAPAFRPADITRLLRDVRSPLYVVTGPDGALGLATGGTCGSGGPHELRGMLAPVYPEWLGDRSFSETHRVRFPYVAGEMAKGIASVPMVVAMAEADMLGIFGAGGLHPAQVEQAVDELHSRLPGRVNWGVNLLHSPSEPAIEEGIADVLIRRRVPCVSASAYLDLTPAVVRCAIAGIARDRSGRIVRRTRMMAKVSRPEVAERFLSPAPPELLRVLLDRGELTAEEAALAAEVPIAEDVTVEADSGGHTDNRPLGALMPVMLGLRSLMARRHGFQRPIRIGAAGGLGTPASVAAAFAAGADYVVTGTVNQASTEAALSDRAKQMLAGATVADVAMAPCADMFEMGVRVQVLRRGTLYAPRAALLYDLYRTYDSLDALPPATAARLEKELFGRPLAAVWEETERFWARRDPGELDRPERDPKHRMALMFRWYLGLSSLWAVQGDPARALDYQIWCGPAMGAFNRWRAGTFLDDHCSVVQIARNLLEGAAVITRAQQARTYGVPVPAAAFTYVPRPLS